VGGKKCKPFSPFVSPTTNPTTPTHTLFSPFIFFFFFCLSPLPRRHTGSARLVSRQRSRSLTELTRQIAPPTKNGHAPPPLESRKIRSVCQSSLSPDLVRFPVLSQIKPQTPFRWCPLPSIPLSFRLATILPPEPGNSKVSRNVVKKWEGPGRSFVFFFPPPPPPACDAEDAGGGGGCIVSSSSSSLALITRTQEGLG